MQLRLARTSLFAAFLLGALTGPATAQSITPVDASELPPLWEVTGPPSRMHRPVTAPVAPLVTPSLPEDAAWEGFLTPANRGSSGVFVEYHGKLVLTSDGIAGSVLTHGLVMWDGTKFESLPAIVGFVSALGVWNDHLIAATQHGPPTRYAILQLNGTTWDTLGTANSYIEKFGEFEGHLIAGGRFTSVNGVPCSRVAAFDGSSWSNAGTGISGFEVTGLTVHLGKLIAGGNITPAQGIVSLDALGGVWQAVGTGFGSGVTDVLSDGVDLFASGPIWNSTNTAQLGAFMRWNGTVWSGTGSPANYGVPGVYMTRWNGKIAVSAPLPTAATGLLALWDGSALTSIPGDSLRGQFVRGIGTWGTTLVVTGPPLNGSVRLPSIATYDGAQWGTVQEEWRPGMFGTMRPLNDMRSWGGKLIVTGTFAIVAEQDHWVLSPFLAAWDGTHWSQLGSIVYGSHNMLGEYEGDLIVAGSSLSVGPQISGAARWNGVSWSGFGTGPPWYLGVESIAEFQNQLYLGADEGLWHWNHSTWSSVPALDNQYVLAIAPSGPRLVVGGWFAQDGAIGSPNVVFWDGTTLQAAGAGVNNSVLTATEWLGQPVIGGWFTASGATPLPGVAIWDGSQWQPMGTRAVKVEELRVQEGELFATGDFRLPDDSIVTSIAHWTGTDWRVLGSGSNGYPFATHGGYLYQAGSGLVHGHLSSGPSRVPLTAVLDVPRPRPRPSNVRLSILSNPVRGRARFAFALPTAGHARLAIYDVGGRALATLADNELDAGTHERTWEGAAAPGVYFLRLDAPSGHVSQRFVLLKP